MRAALSGHVASTQNSRQQNNSLGEKYRTGLRLEDYETQWE